MTELQPIDKWLLDEADDSLSYTGYLTIDYICSHVSKEHSLYAKDDFKRFGIKETLYQIAGYLNLRFMSLKCHVRASISRGRLEFRFHNYNSVTDNTDEYMAFLQRTITARREELKRLIPRRTKAISGKVKITEINSLTEAAKQRIIAQRVEERELLRQK